MSRTDAHRPYRVWLADHPEHAIAVHSHAAHAAGRCDLPLDRAAAGTSCRWQLPYWAGPHCSCRLCGGGLWHRLDTRRRRQQELAALRQRPQDLDDWAGLVVGLPDH